MHDDDNDDDDDDGVAQHGSPGAGENTLRRLALFVYLNHPTKNDVTSGKKER